MLPVLLTIGPISISSFGFFLSLGFIYGSFLVWRLARAWELNEEKILDLIILTFFGGLIGARIYFVILNFDFFRDDLSKILFITKYPGMSFWGGFLGGWLMLYFFSRRFKFNFLQVADLAAVGFTAGLILSDIGCFLGGCSIGRVSNLFFASPVVGVVGNRFPIQLIEALSLLLVFLKTWSGASHFHTPGKIVGLTLIYIGIIKLIGEYFRAIQQGGYFLSLSLIVLGMYIYYSTSKSSIKNDIKLMLELIFGLFTGRTWMLVVVSAKKSWYNFRVRFAWNIRLLTKLLRRARVKPTPKDF